jgi:hypothetical protein
VGFQQEGAPSIEGGFVLAEEKSFWEFQVSGFPCRYHNAIIGCFRRYSYSGLICIEMDDFPKRRVHYSVEGALFCGRWLDLRV